MMLERQLIATAAILGVVRSSMLLAKPGLCQPRVTLAHVTRGAFEISDSVDKDEDYIGM